MTAVNHSLTGAAIGLIVGQPLLAAVLALISHYICDALPHYGTNAPQNTVLKSNAFRNYLIAEAILCFLVVLALAILQPAHWLLAAVCAFIAASPDLLSVNRYVKFKGGQKWHPGLYSRFASGIQWFERPIGAVVEIAWFIGLIAVLLPFIR